MFMFLFRFGQEGRAAGLSSALLLAAAIAGTGETLAVAQGMSPSLDAPGSVGMATGAAAEGEEPTEAPLPFSGDSGPSAATVDGYLPMPGAPVTVEPPPVLQDVPAKPLLEGAPLPTGTDEATYTEVVRGQLATILSGSLLEFFAKAAPEPPAQIAVDVKPEIDRSSGAPRVKTLGITVHLATNEPPSLIRQARQAMLRTLRGNGYRTSEDDPGVDQAPLARLNLDVEAAAPQASAHATRTTAILVAMVLGSVTAFGLFLYLLVLPMRRRRPVSGHHRVVRAAKPGQRNPDVPAGLPPLPHEGHLGPAVDLPPLPGGR